MCSILYRVFCFSHNSILVPCAYSEKRSTQLQDCGLLVNEVIHRKTYLTEHPNTQEKLVRKIHFSCYLYSPDVATEEPDSSTRKIASQSCSRLLPDLGNESGTSTTTARRDNRMLLDLRAFMEDKKCVMLHKDYDKNLQLADGQFWFWTSQSTLYLLLGQVQG